MLTQRWKKADATQHSRKESKSTVHAGLPVGALRRARDMLAPVLRVQGKVVRSASSGIRPRSKPGSATL